MEREEIIGKGRDLLNLGRGLYAFADQQVRLALAPPAAQLSDADRAEIETDIHAGGQLSTSYGFMLFSACGIAALGLLQSSAAVVIGAMLISPLMGPILSMGMAFARVEPRQFRRAATTLAVGALLSVSASTLIVWASPLRDITPEILSRTRPTLLDLIVALLSGFVGAYLTINRKGGTIAGVAIATALMPPLAVVGYGIATGSASVAGGALLLFLTNVVAILGAVFGVARRYGFRPRARTGSAWEAPALFAVMALLSIPLAFSLRNIVVEARETARVRGAIERAFDGASPHITDLKVQIRGDDAGGVEAVVVTRRYIPGVAAQVAQALKIDAMVSIEQVVAANGIPTPDPAGGALANRPTAAASPLIASGPRQRLEAMLSPAGRILSINEANGALEVRFAMSGDADLPDYLALEQAAQQFVPETVVEIVPPIMDLPEVTFDRGSRRLGPQADQIINAIGWALDRWRVDSVVVEGGASPNRRGRRASDFRMAEGRAEAVADRLRDLGVDEAEIQAAVPERIDGPESDYLYAKVRLRPRTNEPAPAAE